MWLPRTLLLIFVGGTILFGQSPAFEVASIRPPHHSDRYVPRSGSITDRTTLFRLENYTLFSLLIDAWRLHDYQLAFAPGIRGETFADDLYDIVARAPGPNIPRPEDARLMLQNLLIERLHVTFHSESKEMRVYALTVSKKGPALAPAARAGACATHSAPAPDGRGIVETFTSCPPSRLADRLGGLIGNIPVLDETGLAGPFDFEVTLTPAYRTRNGATDADISPESAVAPLGLSLLPRKARIDVMTVDHFERPSEN